jgi:hypothetical protein
MNRFVSMICIVVLAAAGVAARGSEPDPGSPSRLDPAEASRFAQLALKCVTREFPNKLDHVMNDETEVRSPKALHPSFYGCFDWHSSVHGHWLLARILRQFPDLPEAPRIRQALDENLSSRNMRLEVSYLSKPERQSFERTYGWAWLLKLAEELQKGKDPRAAEWSANIRPLADALASRYIDFLPKQNYPIRTGVHPNTAFGLAFALDYAKASGNRKLENVVAERAMTYFSGDRDYPAGWEPGGEDFFSPALMEADLMRRVMPAPKFAAWFHAFLPGIARGNPKEILDPASVTDRTDPKLVHLDGLNLSRAWCMKNIAAALPPSDPAGKVLLDAAAGHARAGLIHVASGDYAGEHWLASFAVYLQLE